MPALNVAGQMKARLRRQMRDVEGPVHRAVLAYLRATLPHGMIVQHTANRPRSAIQGGKEKALGAVKGWPDLAIYGPGPDGPSVWFAEVKSPGGKVTQEQRDLHDRIMLAGFNVRIIRSVEDMRNAIAAWGVPTNDRLIGRRSV